MIAAPSGFGLKSAMTHSLRGAKSTVAVKTQQTLDEVLKFLKTSKRSQDQKDSRRAHEAARREAKRTKRSEVSDQERDELRQRRVDRATNITQKPVELAGHYVGGNVYGEFDDEIQKVTGKNLAQIVGATSGGLMKLTQALTHRKKKDPAKQREEKKESKATDLMRKNVQDIADDTEKVLKIQKQMRTQSWLQTIVSGIGSTLGPLMIPGLAAAAGAAVSTATIMALKKSMPQLFKGKPQPKPGSPEFKKLPKFQQASIVSDITEKKRATELQSQGSDSGDQIARLEREILALSKYVKSKGSKSSLELTKLKLDPSKSVPKSEKLFGVLTSDKAMLKSAQTMLIKKQSKLKKLIEGYEEYQSSLKELTTAFEGSSPLPYLDSKYFEKTGKKLYTVGIGHALFKSKDQPMTESEVWDFIKKKFNVDKGQKLSTSQINSLYKEDRKKHDDLAKTHIPEFNDLTSVQREAVQDMVFNMGIDNFLELWYSGLRASTMAKNHSKISSYLMKKQYVKDVQPLRYSTNISKLADIKPQDSKSPMLSKVPSPDIDHKKDKTSSAESKSSLAQSSSSSGNTIVAPVSNSGGNSVRQVVHNTQYTIDPEFPGISD